MADGWLVVALRWVDTHPLVDPMTAVVRADSRAAGASAADHAALEHGLRLAETLGVRCVAVTAGPPAAEDMLREALAVGADTALRVDTPAPSAVEDGRWTARALAGAVRDRFELPRLVLCGDHSADRGTGATPAFLAAELGVVQALGLLDVFAVAGGLRAVRRLDGGRRELLEIPLPAVCSVEPTDVRLRRASLQAVLVARDTPIPVATAPPEPDAGYVAGPAHPYRARPKVLPPLAGDRPHERLLALTAGHADQVANRIVRPANAAEAVDELLGYLRERGYLETAE